VTTWRTKWCLVISRMGRASPKRTYGPTPRGSERERCKHAYREFGLVDGLLRRSAAVEVPAMDFDRESSSPSTGRHPVTG
jgi:hypothetical protein